MDSENDDKSSESGSEAWSSNEGSGTEDDDGDDANDSEAEDDDESGEEDIGLMGFLAPKDVKKLKEAAKTSIEKNEPESEKQTDANVIELFLDRSKEQDSVCYAQGQPRSRIHSAYEHVSVGVLVKRNEH